MKEEGGGGRGRGVEGDGACGAIHTNNGRTSIRKDGVRVCVCVDRDGGR